MLATSVRTPKTRMIRSAVSPRMSRQSHSAPDATMIASMLRKLLVAMRRPFSSSPLFCCRSAFSGTANSPPKNPTIVRFSAARENECPDRERSTANTPMPIDPIGASPSSTLSPDRRPAARLPIAMPIAANVVRMPVQRSLRPMTSVPKRIISSCSSEPRNQK